jgi:hypothetical protein
MKKEIISIADFQILAQEEMTSDEDAGGCANTRRDRAEAWVRSEYQIAD